MYVIRGAFNRLYLREPGRGHHWQENPENATTFATPSEALTKATAWAGVRQDDFGDLQLGRIVTKTVAEFEEVR